jgi:hypothetical protein
MQIANRKLSFQLFSYRIYNPGEVTLKHLRKRYLCNSKISRYKILIIGACGQIGSS